MSNRNKHGTKSIQARAQYREQITKLDLQPTLDETSRFTDTLQTGEELSVPTKKGPRPISLIFKIQEHLKEKWVGWLIAISISIGIFFMRDAIINLAIINTKIDHLYSRTEQISNDNDQDFSNQGILLTKLERQIEQLRDNDHNQELIIQEIKLNIQFIKKTLDIDN